VTTFDAVDYFSDPALIPDPYPYYDHLREECPVLSGGPAGVVTISGHQEALAAYKDPAFSSANAVVGPFAPLPFEPEATTSVTFSRNTAEASRWPNTSSPWTHRCTRGPGDC
jgi:cytochrome P450